MLCGLNKLWLAININVSAYFKQCQTPCHYVCLVYGWWKCTNILHCMYMYNVHIRLQTNRRIDRNLSTWQVMWRLKWFLGIYSFISYDLIFEHIMLTVAICNCVIDCSWKYFTSEISDYSHTGKEYASGKFLEIQKLHNAYSQSQSFSLFFFWLQILECVFCFAPFIEPTIKTITIFSNHRNVCLTWAM